MLNIITSHDFKQFYEFITHSLTLKAFIILGSFIGQLNMIHYNYQNSLFYSMVIFIFRGKIWEKVIFYCVE